MLPPFFYYFLKSSFYF